MWLDRGGLSSGPVLRETQSAVEAAFKQPAPVVEKKQTEKPRKLKYKEERELETIEAVILAAEEKVAAMESMFAAPDFYAKHGTDWETLDKQLDSAKREVARLYARWEELERIKRGEEPAVS